MKNKIVVTLLGTFALLFCLLWIYHAIADDSSSVRLEINLAKDTFLLYEPIWVTLSLTNIGSSPKRVTEPSSLLDRHFCCYVVDSKGDTLSKNASSYALGYPSVIIEPNETISYAHNLLGVYGGVKGKFPSLYFLKPDTHSVQAGQIVNVWSSPDREVVKKSNTLKFTVREPTGEELKACQLLREADDYYRRKKLENRLEKLRRIVDQYPNSVYADLALRKIARTYVIGLSNDLRAIEAFEELIEIYPKSPFVDNAVLGIALFYENKKQIEKAKIALEVIVEKYPNSRASGEAAKILSKIEKGEF